MNTQQDEIDNFVDRLDVIKDDLDSAVNNYVKVRREGISNKEIEKALEDLDLILNSKSRKYNSFILPCKHGVQKITRGFCDGELADLDHTISEWILPRLYAFLKKINDSESKEKVSNVMMMIQAFEIKQKSYAGNDLTDDEREQQAKGLELFAKHFNDLWY